MSRNETPRRGARQTLYERIQSRRGETPGAGLAPASVSTVTHRTTRKWQTMRIRRTAGLVPALLIALLASCGDPSGPGRREVPTGELFFIREASNAPALENPDTTFTVTKGEDTEVEMRYANGDDLLEFRIDDDALLTRPDGSAIREGESVQITIRRVHPTRYEFEFLPAGLRFDPDEQPELRIYYRFADPDFNGDGTVDGRDNSVRFGIWRSEAGTSTWGELTTIRDNDLERLRADVRGFTRFAIATD